MTTSLKNANFELEDFGNKKVTGEDRSSPDDAFQAQEVEKGSHKLETNRHFVQWSEVFDDVYTATGDVKKKLPSSLYKITRDNKGSYYFEKQPIKTDEFIRFSDSIADEILLEIEHFWKLKDIFIKNKFLHRRGYLLYGPQGSGKSIIVQQIIDGIIKMGGIAIWADSHPGLTTEGIQVLRRVESERPAVIVFEDIDAIIKRYGESEILSYLDGEGQTDKILNLATTNYPERLDKRIVARPRRFDRVIKIDTPGSLIRREYFKYKVKDLTESQLEQWVTSTSGFSFAALADLIISVKCFNYSFEDAIEKLRKLLDSKPSSEEFKTSKAGFDVTKS